MTDLVFVAVCLCGLFALANSYICLLIVKRLGEIFSAMNAAEMQIFTDWRELFGKPRKKRKDVSR